MEPAVTAVLVRVFVSSRAYSVDDLGDAGPLRLRGEPEARSLAAGGPHSRWNP